MSLFPDNCDHGTPAFRTCEDCLMQIADLKAKLAAAEARATKAEHESERLRADMETMLQMSREDDRLEAWVKDWCNRVSPAPEALRVAEARVAELEGEVASASLASESLHDRLGQAVTLMREEVCGTLCIMVDPKLVGRNVPGGITNSDQVPDCDPDPSHACWWCRVRAYIRAYDTWTLPDYAKEHGRIVDGAIHRWFELTYAQYLTIPRTALQSMPLEWQDRFVHCLEELDVTIDWLPEDGQYWVKLKDTKGRYMRDPLQDYERGRRRLPRKP